MSSGFKDYGYSRVGRLSDVLLRMLVQGRSRVGVGRWSHGNHENTRACVCVYVCVCVRVCVYTWVVACVGECDNYIL